MFMDDWSPDDKAAQEWAERDYLQRRKEARNEATDSGCAQGSGEGRQAARGVAGGNYAGGGRGEGAGAQMAAAQPVEKAREGGSMNGPLWELVWDADGNAHREPLRDDIKERGDDSELDTWPDLPQYEPEEGVTPGIAPDEGYIAAARARIAEAWHKDGPTWRELKARRAQQDELREAREGRR